MFLVRRYVSLRETHPRLCTFASPRRVPSGHGDPLCTQKLWAHKTDWHGDLRARGKWGKSRAMRCAWRPSGTNPVGNSPGHGDPRAGGEIDKEPRMNTNGHEEGTADDADGRRWVYGMGGMRPLRGRGGMGADVSPGSLTHGLGDGYAPQTLMGPHPKGWEWAGGIIGRAFYRYI